MTAMMTVAVQGANSASMAKKTNSVATTTASRAEPEIGRLRKGVSLATAKSCPIEERRRERPDRQLWRRVLPRYVPIS
jgi:hypothetical protein